MHKIYNQIARKKIITTSAIALGVVIAMDAQSGEVVNSISEVSYSGIYCHDENEALGGHDHTDMGASMQQAYPGFQSWDDFRTRWVTGSPHLSSFSECGGTSTSSSSFSASTQAIRTLTAAARDNILFQILGLNQQLKGGGSGDTPSSKEFNMWATPGYTSVNAELDKRGAAHSNTDMYQISFGGDAKTGDLIYGLSGAYNRADAGATRSDDYRIAPYAAYSFTKNLYATAITGFSRRNTDTPRSNRGSDSNGIFTDTSLSYIQPMDQAILVGKVGHRFGYSINESIPKRPRSVSNDNAWDNTWYVGGDVLYKLGNFLPYTGLVWEHLDPEESNKDQDSAFLKLGMKYSLQNDIVIGAAYQTELTGHAEDKKVSYHQAQLDLRISF